MTQNKKQVSDIELINIFSKYGYGMDNLLNKYKYGSVRPILLDVAHQKQKIYRDKKYDSFMDMLNVNILANEVGENILGTLRVTRYCLENDILDTAHAKDYVYRSLRSQSLKSGLSKSEEKLMNKLNWSNSGQSTIISCIVILAIGIGYVAIYNLTH